MVRGRLRLSVCDGGKMQSVFGLGGRGDGGLRKGYSERKVGPTLLFSARLG